MRRGGNAPGCAKRARRARKNGGFQRGLWPGQNALAAHQVGARCQAGHGRVGKGIGIEGVRPRAADSAWKRRTFSAGGSFPHRNCPVNGFYARGDQPGPQLGGDGRGGRNSGDAETITSSSRRLRLVPRAHAAAFFLPEGAYGRLHVRHVLQKFKTFLLESVFFHFSQQNSAPAPKIAGACRTRADSGARKRPETGRWNRRGRWVVKIIRIHGLSKFAAYVAFSAGCGISRHSLQKSEIGGFAVLQSLLESPMEYLTQLVLRLPAVPSPSACTESAHGWVATAAATRPRA